MDENNKIGPSAPTNTGEHNQPGGVTQTPPVTDLPTTNQKPTMPSTGVVPKTVEVNRDALDKLLDRVGAIEKENKMLKEIADKGRLAHWETTHKGEAPKIYRVSTYQEKIIVGWEMRQNRVWKDEKGDWKEKQEIEITTADGQTATIPYIEFVTNVQKIDASLVSTERKNDKTYLTVEIDGKELKIDSVFIN